MFADSLPPLTYYADWDMVGWPASLIVPLALTASLITLFFLVARRDRPWRSVAVLVLCVALFVAADYVVYQIGYNYPSLWRGDGPRGNPDFQREKNSSDKPRE